MPSKILEASFAFRIRYSSGEISDKINLIYEVFVYLMPKKFRVPFYYIFSDSGKDIIYFKWSFRLRHYVLSHGICYIRLVQWDISSYLTAGKQNNSTIIVECHIFFHFYFFFSLINLSIFKKYQRKLYLHQKKLRDHKRHLLIFWCTTQQ